MSLRKFNIIGCGYIGKKIARGIPRETGERRCFINTGLSKKNLESSGIQAYQFDLDKEDSGLTQDQVQGFSNSRIAYLVPPPRKGVVDTRMSHFISLLENLKTPPESILLISTTGVYGDCKGEWIDETRELKPQAERAIRRVSAEEQLGAYADKHAVPCIVFRVPGIYAAEKMPLKRLSSGEPVVRAADSGFTNRIHADDLAAFCIEALVSDVTSGIYNCCDGHPSTMNDYFMKVADAVGIERPAEISLQQAKAELSAGMLSYLAESKRILNKKLLDNFKTKMKYPDLDAGLKSISKNTE